MIALRSWLPYLAVMIQDKVSIDYLILYQILIKSDSAATDLANKLDGLPLALATAGAYLEQVSINYTEYLQLYQSSWQQLHKETPQLAAYNETLYSTWNVSYRYIEQQSPIAAMLLCQWAYFASEDLWFELLDNDSPQKPEWLRELTKTALSFHACLRLLCSHGIVVPNCNMWSLAAIVCMDAYIHG
jgi:hypothetical protein